MVYFSVMEINKRKYDLEDRLVDFACLSLEVCNLLPNTRPAQNISYQLSKSCTSAALNYGEAQAAESAADFIHKLKLVLKEIRESRINLRIIQQKPLVQDKIVGRTLEECNQLMAIFIASIETARKNKQTSR